MLERIHPTYCSLYLVTRSCDPFEDSVDSKTKVCFAIMHGSPEVTPLRL
jgi:hypothetical protein